MESLPKDKFPKDSKLRSDKAEIMAERVYKMAIYVLTTVVMFYLMKVGGYLHYYLLGDQSNPQYMKNYPCQHIPDYLDDLYIVKLGYHLFELCNTILF